MKRAKISKSCKLHILLVLVLLGSSNANAQTKKEITIGYVDAYEKFPKITFLQSSQSEYYQYPNLTYLSKPELKSSKTHHIIITKGKKFTLKKYKDYGGEKSYSGYEYLGYLSSLKMYAVTDNFTAEHMGFSTMVLIDSLTDYQYAIASIGDGAVETPISSPDCKYLVYFYNWPYQDNSCFIGLLKVNDRTKPPQLLAEMASFDTKNWAVEQIKWINSQTFLVKAFTVQKHNRQGNRTYQYFKVLI